MIDLAHAAITEALVQNLLDDADAPGAVVALSVDGEVWSAGIGHCDLARTTPIAADTPFALYSITKSIIATIVLRMVEDKSFALDDPIQDLVPGFPIETPISIRQVLNHTGGLPDYGGLPEYHAALRAHPDAPWTSAEFLGKTLGRELLYMPGHGWRYSNIGYMLLRMILESETGLTLGQVVRQYLTFPFGIGQITIAATLDDMADLAPGYSTALGEDGVVDNVIPRYHPGWVAHGLARSPAPDVARFLDLLFNGDLMEPPLLNQMLMAVPVTTTHPWMSSPSYALGLMMDPTSEYGPVAGHTGGGPGYSTAAYHFPHVNGHHVSSVAFVNRDGNDLATDIVFAMVQRFAASHQ